MKLSLLTLFLIFGCTISFSQKINITNSGACKISGKVAGLASREPLEYATIALIDESSIKVINGSITDKKGAFEISNIKPGNYSIRVESMGFNKFIRKGIVINKQITDTSIAIILLEKNADTLQNVTVTSTRQTIENKIDKIVYNVDKDITSQGGVVTDALKKIPGVTVDVDGNVELLGNPNIRFLIDGKPSGIFGNSVADALQSIPNSQIQSIEVISSPSVKYDASGTGGIINIILKKNKIEGFNGNINLAIGTRLENGSINLGWKHNKVSINAFYSGNAQLRANTPNGMNRIALNTATKTNTQLIQESNTNFSRNGYNGGLSIDLAISKKESLMTTLGYHHMANMNDGNTEQFSNQLDSLGNQVSSLKSYRIYNNHLSVNTFDNSLVYRRQFKKDKQSLEISYSGSFGKNNTYYNQSQYYQIGGTAFAGSNSLNPGIINEINFAVDYTQQLGKTLTLETGIKATSESIISNADVYTLNASNGNYMKDEMQSYSSNYHRNIYAGYIGSTFSLFKYLDVKVGLRNEHTISTATYSNASNVLIPNYENLAPALVISHNLSNNQTIKLSYSYRLERPDYRDLNPFMNLSDPHNITTGNPNLQPEIGHNYQLAYNKTYESGLNIYLLLFVEYISPDIKPYIIYYPTYKIGDSIYTDVTLTTRKNISSETKEGVNISLSMPIGKKISIRTNTMFFNRRFDNIYTNPSVTNTFSYRLNLNATYQFNKQFAAEGFGNFNSGSQWQGKQPSVFSYTLALRKQIFQNKGSLGIVVVNAFNQYIEQKTFLTAQNVIINSYRNIPYRSFGLIFTYKFGKLKFIKPKSGDNYLYSPPVEN